MSGRASSWALVARSRAGCSAVTVSISGGGGTGATATTTLTSGETNASVGPTMIWEQLYNGGIASMLGLGQCDLTAARICFGRLGNSGQAWETTPSAQPTFVIPGHIEFDTANGGGHNGFTGGEGSDAGGSVLQLQNAALTANAGLQVGFERGRSDNRLRARHRRRIANGWRQRLRDERDHLHLQFGRDGRRVDALPGSL